LAAHGLGRGAEEETSSGVESVVRRLIITSVLLGLSAAVQAVEPSALMPQTADSTQMWWAEGFPSPLLKAPWLRVIQTGRFAMAMNTETLHIDHFGAVTSLADDFRPLPPADLVVTMAIDGKEYRAVSGGPWSPSTGPRLIESGRFFQRGDVTDVRFQAPDGSRLNVEARLETAAWSDRLSFILAARPPESWKTASMGIQLRSPKGELKQQWELPKDKLWAKGEWRELGLALDPITFRLVSAQSDVTVVATEFATKKDRPVTYDATLGWHCINLDGIEPIPPPGGMNPSNDAIERISIVLTNPSDHEHLAKLMFEKTTQGIHQRIGTPITGISAILRDADGHPTGIPVQLSKNWHAAPERGAYAAQWFHGVSQVRLPAKASVELELTLAYGHWGGVPAASHAQLCLIGWGSHQLWDQSALGAWGESLCYEPDQVQAQCSLTDVRPAMVKPDAASKSWNWTGNVGGGDFFRCFDPAQIRVPHSAMRTTYHRQGPCLTEVTYAGRIGPNMTHSVTTSLARTDDLVRNTYRLRLDVTAAIDFSRFVIFQTGADTYNSTKVSQMALGNEGGLIKEWSTHWGGNTYRTEPMECTGRLPWISLHDAKKDPTQHLNTTANRGLVIRSWKAKLGGKEAAPWIAERGLTLHKRESSTLDIIPPPSVTRFEIGDFIEATLEFIIMPQKTADYYGPNEALRAALAKDANTWRMISREAMGNDHRVEMKIGTLVHVHPAVTVKTMNDAAEFTLTGGLGFVPMTLSQLSSPRGCTLFIDEKPVNQDIHGHDYWQTDFDAVSKTWSQTYTVPISDTLPHIVRFSAGH
jgi:hypothetical protein